MTMVQTLTMEIQGYADGSWPTMIDAAEVQKITGVSQSVILQHAKNKACPHVLIGGTEIKFLRKHIVRWVRENLLSVCEGVALSPLPVVLAQASQWNVPASLSMIADRLFDVPEMTGVYFLVHKGEVVYVGQSENVASRMKAHKDKEHDRALFLPCAPMHLDRIEAAFIGLLKPRLNKQKGDGRLVQNCNPAFDRPDEVLASLLADKRS